MTKSTTLNQDDNLIIENSSPNKLRGRNNLKIFKLTGFLTCFVAEPVTLKESGSENFLCK